MATAAGSDWQEFLDAIQVARISLKCSASRAWFRGHSNAIYMLQPTILRKYIIGDLFNGDSEQRYLSDNDFATIFNFIESKARYRLRISADQAKNLKLLLIEAISAKEKLKTSAKVSAEAKFFLTQMQRARQGGAIDARFDLQKLNNFAAKYQIPIIPGTSNGSVETIIKSIDAKRIVEIQDMYTRRQKDFGAQIDQICIQLRAIISVAFGERDAFTEFNFRWRTEIGNSWSVLARMQHYGTSTRLLDWSESLFVALWFALEKYINEADSARRADPNISPESVVSLIEDRLRDGPDPSIWIMNPYFLAQSATGQNRISDFSLGSGLDYYRAFFVDGWPYKMPVPIYSPWRDADRLSSQHAMFTVHGTDLRPLDQQVGPQVARQIKVGKRAAAYGAYQLSCIFPTDRFSLFKDMDSLGKVINERHIHRE